MDIQLSQDQNQPVQNPQPTPPKSNKKVIVIAIIFLALLSAGAGAYYYFFKSINWETYQNEKYGFELKHPRDWPTEEINYPNGGHNLFIGNGGTESLAVIFTPQPMNPEKLINSSRGDPGFINGYKQDKTNVNNLEATKISYVSFNKHSIVKILIKKDDINFYFQYSPIYEQQEKIITKILSTFKFTK